jgi:CheY-like chemotaxis protein
MIVDGQFGRHEAPRVIETVRGEPRGRCLPIIGIAGETTGSDLREAAAIDIADWLQKPILAERLDEALAAAIARASVEMPLVLHVDDDRDTLEITAAALAGVARLERACDLASARAFLSAHHVDILSVDIALPDGSGLDLVTDLSDAGRGATPIIIYSAQDGGSHLHNVEAVLTKSRKSLPNLVETILSIRERQEKGEENKADGHPQNPVCR